MIHSFSLRLNFDIKFRSIFLKTKFSYYYDIKFTSIILFYYSRAPVLLAENLWNLNNIYLRKIIFLQFKFKRERVTLKIIFNFTYIQLIFVFMDFFFNWRKKEKIIDINYLHYTSLYQKCTQIWRHLDVDSWLTKIWY